MEFNAMIRGRRIGMGLGIRKLARLTCQPFVPSPIKSAVYLSRLEDGHSADMPVGSVTIDKMWGLGVVLRVNPFELFLLSRGQEKLIPNLQRFAVRNTAECDFGNFVRSRRADLGMSMREAVLFAKPWDISVAYWSQMESDFRSCSSKISGEKLWGMGTALDVDPLLLFVLSRRIDTKFLSEDERISAASEPLREEFRHFYGIDGRPGNTLLM